MKYKSANAILPKELIETLQQYVQGEYIYIPIKDKGENDELTEYELELQKRDEHIYTRSLEGLDNKRLAKIYNLSESSIRRIIIKQRKGFDEMKERVSCIIKDWNVVADEIKQLHDNVWQVGKEYVLKAYEDVGMLERNIKIKTILGDKNIPVGCIINTNKNTTFAKDDRYYYTLSQKVHGNNIVSLKGNMTLASDMGEIIARLHIAFKECETQDEFWNNSLLAELKGWIKDALNNSGWKCISKERFDRVEKNLDVLYDYLPVQLIHRDVHFGNFLFDNGKFSGYIDFDLSQRNIRIFDLCYFMLGLLSEKDKLELEKDEWFSLLKNVFMGYQKRITLSDKEKQAVPYVMMAIELLFVAWFASQNDVKCAEDAMKIFDFVDSNAEQIIRIVEC